MVVLRCDGRRGLIRYHTISINPPLNSPSKQAEWNQNKTTYVFDLPNTTLAGCSDDSISFPSSKNSSRARTSARNFSSRGRAGMAAEDGPAAVARARMKLGEGRRCKYRVSS